MYVYIYIYICIHIYIYICIAAVGWRSWTRRSRICSRGGSCGKRERMSVCVFVYIYGCISMQRYWSSLRYSFLRTVFVGRRLRRQPTPARPFPSFFCLSWCGLSRAGFLSFPAPFSLRVSIRGIPLPVLLSNMCIYIYIYIYSTAPPARLDCAKWRLPVEAARAVSVCVYMCVCIHIYIYIYIHTYIYTYIYVYIYVCMYLCIYIYSGALRWLGWIGRSGDCSRSGSCGEYMYIYMCVCMYIYMYIMYSGVPPAKLGLAESKLQSSQIVP